MRIKSVHVTNYMAFRDTGTVELDSGFSVIVGKNNAGKTALLNAASMQISNRPHLSVYSVHEYGVSPTDKHSRAEYEIKIEKAHIRKIVTSEDGSYYLPEPAEALGAKIVPAQLFDEWSTADPESTSVRFSLLESQIYADFDAFGLYQPQRRGREASTKYRRYYNDEDGQYRAGDSWQGKHDNDTIETRIVDRARQSVFRFAAERPRVGECGAGVSTRLVRDASNLPEVINALQPNSAKFERFNKLVNRVLPLVRWISVHPLGNDRVGIRVWMVNRKTEREDLAIRLLDCGTGIGQVIAMLYVVFTAPEPQVIVIDEPQSFLHPSAVRELIAIFRDHPQHQYIIATHSPQIIAAARPCHIIQITHDGNEASISQSSSEDVEAVRNVLTDVGARFSDIFGADRLLWVEGSTEARCFPLLLQSLDDPKTRGVECVPVVSTADFSINKKRNIMDVLEIYSRMSTGHALMPPAVAFLFDREELSESTVSAFEKRKDATVKFLPRRMYENYLLSADAITEMLNQDLGGGYEVSTEEVSSWIEEHGQDPEFFPTENAANELSRPEWRSMVHGAKLLSSLFSDLSNDRVEYRKVSHGERLTHWLLEHSPDDLCELASLLATLLADKNESHKTEARTGHTG